MKINEIIKTIEEFAPPETQEPWDNCGWQIFYDDIDANKIMLCLSVTEDIINQAKKENCGLIVAHHPMFFIPFELNQKIGVYSAHTNLDKADGGTTDTIIKLLGYRNCEKVGDFLRIVEDEILLEDFMQKLKTSLKLSNLRLVNNSKITKLRKIAFCAGSGSEFIELAKENGAEILITGDVKYHTALDSKIALIDIGHFESEIVVLETLKTLLKDKAEIVIAEETSPFKVVNF